MPVPLWPLKAYSSITHHFYFSSCTAALYTITISVVTLTISPCTIFTRLPSENGKYDDIETMSIRDAECRQHVDFRTTFESKATHKTTDIGVESTSFRCRRFTLAVRPYGRRERLATRVVSTIISKLEPI